MSNIDLTITDQTPISLEITTSNVEVISNTTLEFNPTQDIVALEVYPAVVYSVSGGGAAAGVNSISNAQGTATGDITLSGTTVKISKTGNTFAFAVDPSAPFFNATMEQLTAGNGLLGGTITTSGTISADFGTVANKIMEGNDSRVTGLKTMAYQESSNINVTGGNIQDVYTIFNGYTHAKVNEAQFVYVTNRTGSTISKGQVVYIVDALGDVLRIGLAQADTETTSSNVLGLAAEDIADSAFGYVMVKGEFVGVRTNNIGSEGDTVYLSEVNAGGMRTGIPEAPNHGVRIGVIVKSAGVGAGIIQVDVDNYQELSELSDVHITGVTNGHMIQWVSANNRWENFSPPVYAPTGASYVVLGTNSTLSNERVLTVGDHITLDDGGANGNLTVDWLYNPRKDIFLFNECHNTDNMTANNANSGSVGFTDGSIANSEQVGIARIRSGSTTNGRASFGSSTTDQILFGTRAHKFETRTRVQTLSDATDRFEVMIGFFDAFTSTSIVDGAWFEYTDNVNGGRFECITSSNSTTTTTDSGITAATSPYHKFTILVNTAATEVKFNIDDVTVATHTTNIPTGSGRNTGFGCCLRKTGAGGTADRFLTTDYINLEITGQNR